MYKQCGRCKEIKGVDAFSKNKSCNDGLSSYCRCCKKISDRAYRDTHKEEFIKRNKLYKITNKERISLLNKSYREANQEKISKQRKGYREANKDKIAIAKKEWHNANKERLSIKKKEYHQNNRDSIIKKAKEWASANPEKVKLLKRVAGGKRVKRIKELSDGTVTAESILKIQVERLLCPYCGKGLNQSNTHMDHMNPISKGGLHSIKNLIMCCDTCNTTKNATLFDDWVQSFDEPFSSIAMIEYNRKQEVLI